MRASRKTIDTDTRLQPYRDRVAVSDPRAPEPHVSFLLTHLSQDLVARLEKQLRKKGVTHDQWRVLKVTSEVGTLNIMDLHDATLVPHSTLGRWLHRLESLGLVQMRTDPNDQRSVAISIAPQGRKLYESLLPVAERCEREALAGLSRDEERQLRDLIGRVSVNLGRP